MKKRPHTAILLLGLLVGLSGCSVPSPARLGSRLFVENAGIDLTETQTTLSLNGFLPDLSDGNAFLTQSGDSIPGAMEALAQRTGRQPYFPHNGALIVGQDAARSGIDGILRFFSAYPECRGSVPLFVADTTAAAALDAIRTDPTLDNRTLIDLVDGSLHTGRTLYTPVYRAAAARAAGHTDIAAPVLSVTETGVEISGTAVFRGDALALTLSPDETAGLQLITGTASYVLVHVPIGGTPTAFVVTVRRHALRLTSDGERPRFVLALTCIAAPGDSGGSALVTDDATAAWVAAECARRLRGWAESCAARTARVALDPMGFTELALQSDRWAARAASDRSAFLRSADFSAEIDVRTVRGSAP